MLFTAIRYQVITLMSSSTDTVVIGAGVVGLAIARDLALAGREVIVLEKNAAIGEETSARNSEVIHAGLYYPRNSLKARFCVEGRQRHAGGGQACAQCAPCLLCHLCLLGRLLQWSERLFSHGEGSG